MGCCCSTAFRERRPPPGPAWPAALPDIDLEAGIPPPPYSAVVHSNSRRVTVHEEKPPREPSIFSASTTLYDGGGEEKGQDFRVGVRTSDHRLYAAAAGGHLDEVKKLLDDGFNPSDRTTFDWCPLHWAAHNNNKHGFEIVKLLVDYGADLNQVSDTGVTPLDLARKAKRSETIKFLKGMGAKTGLQVQQSRLEAQAAAV